MRHFRGNILDAQNPDKHRLFFDNNADVLLVAHLDTVCSPKLLKTTKKRIWGQGLDDRLGCYIAYKLQYKHGLDLLLTDHEEAGQTTAQYHKCAEYNWIAEFDRAGSDAVTYDQDCPAFRKALEDFWVLGWGSFSDICELETTACCVNIGIGYQHAHSKDSYADKEVMRQAIAKFQEFYALHKSTKFVIDNSMAFGRWGFQSPQYSKYDYAYELSKPDPDNQAEREIAEQWKICDHCGLGQAENIFGYLICRDCLEYLFETSAVR